jgi:hypothetical protein
MPRRKKAMNTTSTKMAALSIAVILDLFAQSVKARTGWLLEVSA